MRKNLIILFLILFLTSLISASAVHATTTAVGTVTPSPNNVPKARTTGVIDPGWIASNLDYSSNYASLNSAQVALGAAKTLVVNTAISLTGNLTTTIGLMVINGGSINTAGYTLNINGPWNPATPGTIITGGGTVVFGSGVLPGPANPAWFGGGSSGATAANATSGTSLLLINSPTPSVAAMKQVFRTANTAPTTITAFSNMVSGQTWDLDIGDSHTTIGYASGNIIGHAGVNWAAPSGSVLHCTSDGTYAYCLDSDKALMSIVPIGSGGTGQTTAAAALSALGGATAQAVTAGTYPKITVNAQGVVTSGTTLSSGDIPANAANTSGTAANLSGTPALPNGTTATTQTTGDNTNDLATDAFVNASILATPQIAANQSWRNRFINGDMRIDQRNAGAAQMITVGAGPQYTVDRWYSEASGANITGQQIAGATPWKNAYRLTGAASNTGFWFNQRIESINILDLATCQVTLSIYAASSSLTSLNWAAVYPSALDNWAASTGFASGSWTINSTLTQYTATFTLPSNCAKGLWIQFAGGALLGSQTFTITGAQLEAGTIASPFERRPDDIESLRCQRYLPKLTYASLLLGTGVFTSSTSAQFFLNLPGFQRVAPTGVVYSAANIITAFDTNVSGFTAHQSSAITFGGTTLVVTVSGATAGHSCTAILNGGSIYFTGCEL